MIVGGYDLETTGLNEPDHRIIEICLITYDMDPVTFEAEELECWTQRVNPQRSIDLKAKEVHGIHESDLIGKPVWQDVAPILVPKLDRLDLGVGHNMFDFDAPFTIRELERINHALPDFDPFDTMIDGRWATAFGKAPNLAELCWASGEPYDPKEAHAAEYDVRRMMACFFYGLRRGVFKLSTPAA